MKKKTNFIFLLTLLGSSWRTQAAEQSKNSLDLAFPQNIPTNPFLLSVSIFYLLLLLAGIVILSILLLNKIKGKPLFFPIYPQKKFPLNLKESINLILELFFFLVLTHFLSHLLLHTSNISSIYIILGSNLFLQFASLFVVLRYIKFSFFNLSMQKKDLNFVFLFYTASVPIIFISLLLNFLLFQALGIEPSLSPIEKITPLIDTPFLLFIFTFQAIVTAPLAEEFVFRGVFYKLMRRKYSFLFSALAISLFFALLHRSPAGTLGLFVVSFAICYLYEKTQKIAAAFLFHSLHNLVIFLLFLASR